MDVSSRVKMAVSVRVKRAVFVRVKRAFSTTNDQSTVKLAFYSVHNIGKYAK